LKQSASKRLIELRRAKVLELSAKGYNETEIARMINVPKASQQTVSLDIKALREQAKQTMSKHVQEIMPLEYHKCLHGLDDCIRHMTDIIETEKAKGKEADKKDIIAAVSVRMQAYRFKAEVLDSGIALKELVTFVEKHKTNKNIPQVLYNKMVKYA
jgi:transcriptional regulator